MLVCGDVETTESVKTQSGSWTAVAGRLSEGLSAS